MHSIIKISFLSEWHFSSSVGDGYLIDATLVRDVDGFPYIPGRTMRGCLRLAAGRLGMCRADLKRAENFFWEEHANVPTKNYIGALRISSASFSQDLKRQVLNHSNKKQLIADLTVLHMGTSIGDNGCAKSGSLYTIECGIQGLEMFATIDVDPCKGIDDAWLKSYFKAVCGMVKNLGADSSRGLGRCKVTFLDDDKPVVLPQPNDFLMKLGA